MDEAEIEEIIEPAAEAEIEEAEVTEPAVEAETEAAEKMCIRDRKNIVPNSALML